MASVPVHQEACIERLVLRPNTAAPALAKHLNTLLVSTHVTVRAYHPTARSDVLSASTLGSMLPNTEAEAFVPQQLEVLPQQLTRRLWLRTHLPEGWQPRSTTCNCTEQKQKHGLHQHQWPKSSLCW